MHAEFTFLGAINPLFLSPPGYHRIVNPYTTCSIKSSTCLYYSIIHTLMWLFIWVVNLLAVAVLIGMVCYREATSPTSGNQKTNQISTNIYRIFIGKILNFGIIRKYSIIHTLMWLLLDQSDVVIFVRVVNKIIKTIFSGDSNESCKTGSWW